MNKVEINIATNIKILMFAKKYNSSTLSKISDVPYSTLTAILEANRPNVGIKTIQSLATALNVNISQIVGEIPIVSSINYIPILDWDNIDTNKLFINYKTTITSRFISINFLSTQKIFALPITEKVLCKYPAHNTIIIEENHSLNSTDDSVLLFTEDTGLIATKAKLKENSLQIQISDNKEIISNKYHIFGTVKESRIIEY